MMIRVVVCTNQNLLCSIQQRRFSTYSISQSKHPYFIIRQMSRPVVASVCDHRLLLPQPNRNADNPVAKGTQQIRHTEDLLIYLAYFMWFRYGLLSRLTSISALCPVTLAIWPFPDRQHTLEGWINSGSLGLDIKGHVAALGDWDGDQ